MLVFREGFCSQMLGFERHIVLGVLNVGDLLVQLEDYIGLFSERLLQLVGQLLEAMTESENIGPPEVLSKVGTEWIRLFHGVDEVDLFGRNFRSLGHIVH